jgi:hypothetical protein
VVICELRATVSVAELYLRAVGTAPFDAG